MHSFNQSAVLLLTFWTFWFPGCSDSKPPNRQKAQLIHVLQQEQQHRREAETRADLQSQSRDRWQQAATALGLTSVVVLFVGIILGSKARHEAQRPR